MSGPAEPRSTPTIHIPAHIAGSDTSRSVRRNVSSTCERARPRTRLLCMGGGRVQSTSSPGTRALAAHVGKGEEGAANCKAADVAREAEAPLECMLDVGIRERGDEEHQAEREERSAHL